MPTLVAQPFSKLPKTLAYLVAMAAFALLLAACGTTLPEEEIPLAGEDLQAVVSFTLINADTDRPIAGYDPIPDGAVLDPAELPTMNLNIRANTNPDRVGSVRFELNGNTRYAVQSAAPYALANDKSGDYHPWTPTPGSYRLRAVPYTQSGANGTAGTAATLDFTVTEPGASSDSSGGSTQSGMMTVRLVNAGTDRAIRPLENGDVLDLEALPGQLTLEVIGNGFESVRFKLDGSSVKVESAKPYAIAGDNRGDYRPWTFPLGSHTLEVIAYSANSGNGTVLERQQIRFEVVEGAPTPSPEPEPEPEPEPAPSGTWSWSDVNGLANRSYGPVRNPSVPSNAVVIPAGANIQNILDRHPNGTAFLLRAGVYNRQTVRLAPGDRLIGEYGAILDGQGSTGRAIRGNTNAVVRNIEVRNYTSDDRPAVEGFPGMRIENNYIHHNFGRNVTVDDRTVLRYNKITHGGRYGVNGSSSQDAIVEYNEIAYNNTRRLLVTFDAGGTKFPAGTDGLVFRRNYVHDNHGTGVWVDIRGRGIKIAENLIVRNDDSGILYEISYGAEIMRNVVRGNGRYGIQVSNSTNVDVHHNLVENNISGLSIKGACRDEFQLKNVTMRDNTVRQRQSGSGQFGKAATFWLTRDHCSQWQASREAVYTSEGNRFFRNSYDVGTLSNAFYYKNTQMNYSTWRGHGMN